MEHVLVSPKVKRRFEQFIMQPSHALTIIGPVGAGKAHVATQLLNEILGQAVEKSPYYLHIAPAQGSISIDAVRQLHDFVRLKTIGTRPVRRAVLIEDAHTLTTEAQNALLKTLEEPPADTVMVLTIPSKNAVLPTIYSRTQHIVLEPVTQDAIMSHFTKAGHDKTAVERAYYVSDGQVGLISHLLSKGEDHPLARLITQAKQLMQATAFERLAQVDTLAKQKDSLADLLWALQRVCHAARVQAQGKGSSALVKRWLDKEALILQLREDLASTNVQAKLLLTNLMLHL